MSCACSICQKMLPENAQTGELADLYVYDFDGELNYILLAHQSCAEQTDPNQENWKWDQKS
jgi:hypothetical protein